MEDREIKDLERALEQIWEIARGFGLDPFPTRFEMVPATVMYEIGSYALPGRYSHWTFGKAYQRMKTMYDFGLSKIYEVVINTNPSYGFLLETNSPIQNKLVMAHVLGHVDFFKHNAYFSKTNRRMVDSVSTHATRMAEYEFKYGRKTVERFLDAVLSIEEHIDPNFFIRRERPRPRAHNSEGHGAQAGDRATPEAASHARPKEGPYDDLWNLDASAPPTPHVVADERPRGERLPEKDLVYYILRNSPSLEDWQRDVMAMIHEETEYFIPQMQTKTMNEGWASFWHSRIMRELELTDTELLEFAELHSGVVSPHKGQLNPYYLGYKIFEDIERRWDNPSAAEREKYGRTGGEGRAKIFEVRELDNDVSFLRNYLTEDLCEELDLYVYELVEEEEWTVTEKRWERVRDQLVANMTNFGFPYIVVADGDYNGNRELYLKHSYEGAELDGNYARKVLEHVYALWGRPVHLETTVDDERVRMHYDGEDHEED
ncbi:MAG TPA: SpoVR family protein [Pyrinomonadaceae bacterium]